MIKRIKIKRIKIKHVWKLAVVVLVIFVGMLIGSQIFLWSQNYIPSGPRDKLHVILFCMDGGSWRVMDPLIEKGLLPNFKRLKESGAYGTLMSYGRMVSPIIWTSIATGKGMDKHGITDFLKDGVPVTANMRKTKAIWNILSDNRITVGIVGYYVTWPVEEVYGFMISDNSYNPRLSEGKFYPAHIPGVNEQQDLFWKLRSETKSLRRFIDFDFNLDFRELGEDHPDFWPNFLVDKRLSWPYARDEVFRRFGAKLYKDYHPEFFAIYFKGVDFTGHGFWKHMDPEPFKEAVDPKEIELLGKVIERYYVYMDEVLSDLMKEMGPNAMMIVVSDHGFGADPSKKDRLKDKYWYLTGSHKLEGIFIAYGAGIRSGAEINVASVMDITPTLLALFGLPVAEDMEGKVITYAESGDYLSSAPPSYIGTYEDKGSAARGDQDAISSEADEDIKDKLRALGYI